MSRAVQLVLLSVVILTCLQTGVAQYETPECNVERISREVLQKLLPHINRVVDNLRRNLTSLLDEKVTSLRESVSEDLMDYKNQTTSDLQSNTQQLTQLCTKVDTLDMKLVSVNDSMNRISDNVEAHDNHVTTELMELDQNLQQNFSLQLENSYGYHRHTCGGTGGWRRVAYLNFTDPNTPCPSGWQLTSYSKRTCGKVSVSTCDSAIFPVSGGDYTRVCGRIIAIQDGGPDAFLKSSSGAIGIDGLYVSGVSLTHGSPRQHIWTFAAGYTEDFPSLPTVCPCDADHHISVPPFVGEDYFCESGLNSGIGLGFYPDDPLWDGDGCTAKSTCCSFNNPPYFTKQLPSPTTDDLEARLCSFGTLSSPVEFVELYVQ